MEINVLKESKEEIEIELDNLTIVEILRVYLNKDTGVTFVAWRRNHPTENPRILIKTRLTSDGNLKPLKCLMEKHIGLIVIYFPSVNG